MTIRCGEKLLDLSKPVVMGILNLTPDSFFEGSRLQNLDETLRQAEKMLSENAAILDFGAVSTRPGAAEVSGEDEKKRLIPAIEAVFREFPEAVISVDTFRSGVAELALKSGAKIINDISGGQFDPKMFRTAARLGTPYILSHIKGTPQTMHLEPKYDDVVQEILDYFIREVGKLRELGVADIILDPGFGFGKTIAHNFEILRKMQVFKILDLPILAGVSRKSMVWKTLKTTPENALVGTAALHVFALQQGAKILRAHDVRAANEVIKMCLEIGIYSDPVKF